ncbi:MAG TPA: beta-ketoacyl synthase chain length factor [Chitinophagaceae bacterium]|nr:beta-ketoacyl synthase chain length factor [Chitinophagaceae bacterium]
MNVYIQGVGSISPQIFSQREKLPKFQLLKNEETQLITPEYSEFIQPNQLRRMSKVIRYGIASAMMALKDANVSSPDLIIVGTAYGCLHDTEQFLSKMIENQEALLTPTSFIQSTHNTVSGQIALILSCHGHNFTYVQKAHSFEYALDEAMMWLAENPNLNILCGGLDEKTKHSHQIISRFGTYKKQEESIIEQTEGTTAGEGSNFFLLSSVANENSYAKLSDVYMCYTDDIQNELLSFLSKNKINVDEIDVCLLGVNGDIRYDEKVSQNIFALKHSIRIPFKYWVGEYPTVSAYAVSLASNILYQSKTQNHFSFQGVQYEKENVQNVLIYNHYKNQYHSFILLEKV